MTETKRIPKDEDGSTIVQLIFQKERTEAVDFEVAFTALLATGTFATLSPESPHRFLLQAIASLLLVLTVLRRMAIVGRFAREELVMQSTQQPVEFLALVCLFQIIQSTGTYLCSAFACILSSGFTTLLLALVIVIGIIVIQQLLYRDYFVFWGATFFAAALGFRSGAEEGSLLKRLFFWMVSEMALEIAYLSLKDKIPPGDDKALSELRTFVDSVEGQIEDDEVERTSGLRLSLISGIPLLLIYAIPILAMGLLIGKALVLIFFAFVAVPATGHIIKFLYLAYGSPIENRTYSVSRQFVSKIIYVATVLFLFV